MSASEATELQADIDEMVEAGVLTQLPGDPPTYITSGFGRVWLDVSREYAEVTGIGQTILFNLLVVAELRCRAYERAVVNRLYVLDLTGTAYACGCKRDGPVVRNLVCRNGDCLNYGAHVIGLEDDRCPWCGTPFTLLSEDPLKGAR